MNLLLDTHIALWAITDSAKLSNKAREMIMSPDNAIWVSTVSIWEIAIKYSLRRESIIISSQEALNYFRQARYRLLAIKAEHAIAVEGLAFHHQDPFDRLLVSQALIESMHLITHDTILTKYGETVILV